MAALTEDRIRATSGLRYAALPSGPGDDLTADLAARERQRVHVDVGLFSPHRIRHVGYGTPAARVPYVGHKGEAVGKNSYADRGKWNVVVQRYPDGPVEPW